MFIQVSNVPLTFKPLTVKVGYVALVERRAETS